eukprot:Sspe_Gene.109058::Locus_88400_Transcript_1_1_Confidence_1.000_Length_1725::g.109058::m.109058
MSNLPPQDVEAPIDDATPIDGNAVVSPVLPPEDASPSSDTSPTDVLPPADTTPPPERTPTPAPTPAPSPAPTTPALTPTPSISPPPTPAPTAPTTGPPTASPRSLVATPAPESSSPMVMVIIVAAVLIVLAGVGGYFCSRSRSRRKNRDQGYTRTSRRGTDERQDSTASSENNDDAVVEMSHKARRPPLPPKAVSKAEPLQGNDSTAKGVGKTAPRPANPPQLARTPAGHSNGASTVPNTAPPAALPIPSGRGKAKAAAPVNPFDELRREPTAPLVDDVYSDVDIDDQEAGYPIGHRIDLLQHEDAYESDAVEDLYQGVEMDETAENAVLEEHYNALQLHPQFSDLVEETGVVDDIFSMLREQGVEESQIDEVAAQQLEEVLAAPEMKQHLLEMALQKNMI